MPTTTSLSVIDLLASLGTANAPLVVDVCIEPDFAADPYVLPGAIRHPHTDIAGLIPRLKERPTVIMCQKGRKLSQGVAAWLRADGIDACYLVGGMHAWRDHPGTLRIPASALHTTAITGGPWVTRTHPDIDDLACLWLIHRFIDREARILFVELDEVGHIAERFAATPLDSFMTPLAGSSGKCRFDHMLDHFELGSPPLRQLARLLPAQPAQDITAGLHAIVAGSDAEGASDHDHLTASLPIFDALFQHLRTQDQSGAAA